MIKAEGRNECGEAEENESEWDVLGYCWIRLVRSRDLRGLSTT